MLLNLTCLYLYSMVITFPIPVRLQYIEPRERFIYLLKVKKIDFHYNINYKGVGIWPLGYQDHIGSIRLAWHN